MRNLVVTEFISLDGVIENPSWTMPYWGDDIAAFKAEETSASDALLLGRVTYEGFAAAWPARSGEDSGADYFNGVRKYVVSSTLTQADWNNSVILSGDLAEAVNRIKAMDGAQITVHGSGRLAGALLTLGLVDSLRLIVYPVVLGTGQRLFTDGMTSTMQLVETRPFASGAVGLIYQPKRA